MAEMGFVKSLISAYKQCFLSPAVNGCHYSTVLFPSLFSVIRGYWSRFTISYGCKTGRINGEFLSHISLDAFGPSL